MALLNLFKLEKMRIEAFQDVARTKPATPAKLEVMFNPTSYKRKHAITYRPAREQSQNSPGRPAQYAYTPPGEAEFKLIFDGTGVSEFGIEHIANVLAGKTVSKAIANFEAICLKMDGSTHEPRFLVVKWGSYSFPCRLLTLTINYTLFDASGEPLRAEVDVAFVEDKSQQKWVKDAAKSSPDLTHVRVVHAGDTLPLMCHQIYGSASHYLKVARDNGLDDFRRLVPGQRIVFAPLEADQGGAKA
jgi:hypothetical protein